MSTRRQFTVSLATVAAAAIAPILPITAQSPANKKKIVCVGGHPDDPETGCGGTLALFTAAGHDVTIIYLTRGEAGIPGKTHQEAAAIRTKEAENAAKLLGAKVIFAGQVDGDTVFNSSWIHTMQDLIRAEQPDILFTHWPIDAHKDHQVASLLTIQSWIGSQSRAALYFFEVCSGNQTRGFKPTDYIDISTTRSLKKKAVYCHTSQGPDEIYRSGECNHELMETFRGIEINVPAAEAFVRMNHSTIEGLHL